MLETQKPLSILQATRQIKGALESCFPYPIEVVGEISNFKPHYSGHLYLTLKDEHAQISAVMWRSKAEGLSFKPVDGLEVVAKGKVSVYEKTGRYQLNLLSLKPLGQGDLQAQFEALKRKLWQLGYFDTEQKQTLPAYPKRVGLLTSPTGAAIRDMISVAQRRNPGVELIVRPAAVQGIKAAPDLIQGLKELDAFGVDVIVLGRGGGSLEDLWAFNDETLAKTIYQAHTPIVSAVGHEVDFTISDFVADLRAPTPSAAMELVIPAQDEALGQLRYYQEKLNQLMALKLQHCEQEVKYYQAHHALQPPEQRLDTQAQRIQVLQERLNLSLKQTLTRKHTHLDYLTQRLADLSPLRILERGYVLVEQNQKPVTRKDDLRSGQSKLIFKDGSIDVKIERSEKTDAP